MHPYVEVQSRCRHLIFCVFVIYGCWNSIHEGEYYPHAGIGDGWPLIENIMDIFSWDL